METALRLGGGVMLVADITEAELAHDRLFSERFACPACGISLPEIEPRTFSFNSPHGACPACTGLGSQMEFDPDLLVPDKSLSLAGGAVKPWDRDTQTIYHAMLQSVAEHHQIPFDVPGGRALASTRWTSSSTAARRATRSRSSTSTRKATIASSRRITKA